MGRRHFVLGILPVATGVAGVLTSSGVNAAYNPCDYPTGNWFANISTYDGSPLPPGQAEEGTSANVTYANPLALCTTDRSGQSLARTSNIATGWTKIAGDDVVYGSQYAQSGYIYGFCTTQACNNSGLNLNGDCTRHFAQYEQTVNQFPKTVIGVCAPGVQTHHLWQQYISNAVRDNIDLTAMETANFDPKTWWLPIPSGCYCSFISQWSGETYLQQSDVPGTFASQENYSSMQVQGVDNIWYDACPIPFYRTVSLPRYSVAITSCDAAASWTNNPGGP